MTGAPAQFYNSLRWRVLLSSPLNSYGIQLIPGSENFTSLRKLKASRELSFWPWLNLYIKLILWTVYVNVGEFGGTGGFVIDDETATNN